MKTIPVLLILLLCFACVTDVDAQGGDIRSVFFDTVRAGDFVPTPVGVEDMKYIGNQYITVDDSTIMQYCTRIIQNDIDFYALFKLIVADSFFMKLYELTEMTDLGWRRMGATRLVRLEAEFPGNNLRVRWRLHDIEHDMPIAKGVDELGRNQWRVLGHRIANEIVRTLTGETGIFLTQIAYCKEKDGAKEIYVADFDGSNERQLTRTGSINISPTFHPRFAEIYFTSYVDGPPTLYKVAIADGTLTKVAQYPGIVSAPAISPDGNKIACTLSKDGNSEIYVLNLKGEIIKRLTRNRSIDTAPTWSPDGSLIAFSSDRTGSPQIYIMDSDGLKTRRLTYQGGYNDSPIWSKKGDRITFVSRTKYGRFDLASIDTSGTDYRVHTQLGHNENPHFSPDGNHIVFSSNRLGPREVYIMDLTGRNQRRITRSGGCSNPDWGPVR